MLTAAVVTRTVGRLAPEARAYVVVKFGEAEVGEWRVPAGDLLAAAEDPKGYAARMVADRLRRAFDHLDNDEVHR